MTVASSSARFAGATAPAQLAPLLQNTASLNRAVMPGLNASLSRRISQAQSNQSVERKISGAALRTPPRPDSGASSSLTEASEGYYAFAGFQLYPRQRTLLLDGQLVEIGGRAFDLLAMLVRHAGTVISAKDLMDIVWPKLSVEMANLRVQISIVRKALARCEAAHRAIENIPLRGYCFILPVRYDPHRVAQERQPAPREAALPTLLSPVVGREDAIESIAGALHERGFVTITGPGGVGKTTVAVATSRRYQACFRGSIVFVDLSQASDDSGTIRAIANALACDEQADMRAALFEHLENSETLLILDNCEQIVEPIAQIAEEMLSRCGNLKLLVTSREALRAAGEWIHRLPSLTYPGENDQITATNMANFTAIRLFVDSICSFTRYDLADADLPLLAEICRRLDGNPLALELAAASVPDLGLAGIANQLDNRFRILTRGRRTAPARHQSLAAAIDWSYSLLTDDERSVLRQLTDYPGAFTADQAMADIGPTGCRALLHGLNSLYEKSLIGLDVRDGMPFYFLFDTMRDYVRKEVVLF